jgi:hypothetical protein
MPRPWKMPHVIRRDEGNQPTYGLSVVTCWSRRGDLNPRPADYESAALPTELRRRLGGVTIAKGLRTVKARYPFLFQSGPV